MKDSHSAMHPARLTRATLKSTGGAPATVADLPGTPDAVGANESEMEE